MPVSLIATRTNPLKLALLVGLGTWLLWLVVTHSLVAYLAVRRPEIALHLNSSDSTALLQLAEKRLKALLTPQPPPTTAAVAEGATPSDAGRAPRLKSFATRGLQPEAAPAATAEPVIPSQDDLAEVRVLIERALASDPLNARALSLLGHIAELTTDDPHQADEAAQPYYERAARHSIRESTTIYRLLLASIRRGDYEGALRHADTLLRTRTSARAAVVPVLARLVDLPETRQKVRDLVASDPPPPWRDSFLSAVLAHVTDPRAPLDLLLALKDTPHPPSDKDLRAYLRYLLEANQHELAYYTWLQFLPPQQLASLGLVFNGDFDAKPSGLPFDWVISAGAGVTAEFALVPDAAGQRALRIDFTGGRAQFQGMTQTLVLAPGRYTLSGRVRGEITGRRGTLWRVVCHGTRIPLAQTAMAVGPIPAWRAFELQFTIPARDCPAQVLRLDLDARSSSEQLVSGNIWYDDIRIVRDRPSIAGR
jgi:hypothetical protein